MKKIFNNESGVALPLVLIILIVLSLLGTALWHYSLNELRQVTHEENKTRAYYVARAGAESMGRHIIQNPFDIADIINNGIVLDDGSIENTSVGINFDTEYLGDAGELTVTVKKMYDVDEEIIEVTGIAVTTNIEQRVTMVIRSEPFPERAAIITTGDKCLSFDKDMTINGDIVTASNCVELPNNFNYAEYQYITGYNFPEFHRVEVPTEVPVNDNPDGTVRLNNHNDLLEINSGTHSKYSEVRMNNGTIRFNASEGEQAVLVVDELYIRGGNIEIIGNGKAIIYVTSTAQIQTPNTNYDESQMRLNLAEGSELTLLAGNPFKGLIYGPYNTEVNMQAGADVLGAMIVESLSGVGQGTSIGSSQSLIDFIDGFGELLDDLRIVSMLYWKPE